MLETELSVLMVGVVCTKVGPREHTEQLSILMRDGQPTLGSEESENGMMLHSQCLTGDIL